MVGRTDRHDMTDFFGVTLRESECHHAAVRGPDNGMQAPNAKVRDQSMQYFSLIECADAGEVAVAGLGAGGPAAAPQEIEAEDCETVRIDWAAPTNDAVPPALVTRATFRDHYTAGGNPAECGNDGGVRGAGACQAPGDLDVLQVAAEMQWQVACDREDAFPRVGRTGLAVRLSGRYSCGHVNKHSPKPPADKGNDPGNRRNSLMAGSGFHTSETPTESRSGRSL